jgi:ribose transport system ATP-binding protein
VIWAKGRQKGPLLFGVVRQLRSQGVAVIYVSHRLSVFFALCDRVTILKDGSKVATREISDTDHDMWSGLWLAVTLHSFSHPRHRGAALRGPPK